MNKTAEVPVAVTQVIRDQNERMQIALDKTFGLTHAPQLVHGAHGLKRVVQGAILPYDVPAFDGLRDAYVRYTGDADLRYVGKSRVTQLVNMSTFENALANTLTHLLMKDYATDYRWRDVVTEITSPQNFKIQERVRAGYVADLAEVAEDGLYEEVPAFTDERVSYTVTQVGRTLTITRKVILADDIQAIKRLVDQLGRAAWRTLAKRVWVKLVSNDTYDVDGLPIFHADHGNLGADALSASSLTAAREAIFAQTEPGSSERLGLSGPWMLAVPIELEATALPINSCKVDPGTFSVTFQGNPWYHRFGPEGERIFANPLFSDANNWYLFDISGNVGIIEVGFLMGRQNPEIFVEQEQTGQSLSQDRLVYKMRHEYEAEIVDYRGSYKAVVI